MDVAEQSIRNQFTPIERNTKAIGIFLDGVRVSSPTGKRVFSCVGAAKRSAIECVRGRWGVRSSKEVYQRLVDSGVIEFRKVGDGG